MARGSWRRLGSGKWRQGGMTAAVGCCDTKAHACMQVLVHV